MIKLRIKTGIPGFDSVIDGGYIPDSVNLLTGGTGTGKTLFSLSFLLNGAKNFGERGLYFSVEEQEADIKEDLKSIGFDWENPAYARKIKFVSCQLYEETSNFPSLLREMLEKFKPQRVVIDSMSVLTMPMDNDFERRKEVYEIIKLLKGRACTSILTDEMSEDGVLSGDSVGRLSRYNVAEFLCDSVVVLHYAGIGGEADRALQVVKMRRSKHIRGPVPMSIGQSGVKVIKGKY